MKIGLVIASNRWFCPYVDIYANIFKAYDIDYDILYWDRTNTERSAFSYNIPVNDNESSIKKFAHYFGYSRHLRKIIRRNKYDRLVIFGSACGIFLYPLLASKYKKRFIFDYRDLSIEQNALFKPIFRKLLTISRYNVISSPGFKKCLPKGFDYVLSHNFNIDLVKQTVNNLCYDELAGMPNSVIDVLTIGGIRDFSSNVEVIDALANKAKFRMRFVGRGVASDKIEDYCKSLNVNNVFFHGYYKKENEPDFISTASFMNIYYPAVITHSTALSNRFYNALIYKKPMIVKSNSIQGDFVEKYNLGIAVDDCMGLDGKIIDYIKRFDYREFCKRSDALLNEFISDYDIFYTKIIDFIQ